MKEFSGTLEIDPRLRSAVIPNLVLESDLSTYERMAIAVIAWHGEVAFPKQIRIAHMMGCSIRCAHSTLQSLKSKGWLEITPRRDKRGYRTSNHYRLCIPKPNCTRCGKPNCTSCVSAMHDVRSPNLNPDQNLNSEKKKDEERDTEAASPPPSSLPRAPDTPPEAGMGTPQTGPPGRSFQALPPEAKTARQQANVFLCECEQIIREEYGVPNAISWARDNRIITRLIVQHGYAVVDKIATDELRWFLDHKKAWDIPGFASRFPKSKQYQALRAEERRYDAEKIQENRT